MEKRDWKTLAAMLFCALFFLILIFLLFKYILAILIPFLIAWGIAMLQYPLAARLSKKVRISRRACSFILTLLILGSVILILFWIGNRALFELQRLGDGLMANGDEIVAYFEELFSSFDSWAKELPILNGFENVGFIDKLLENADELLTGIWNGFIESAAQAVPRIAGGIARSLPSVLLVTVVSVVSCFYFALDVDVVNEALKRAVPKSISKHLPFLKKKVFGVIKNYIKAYLLLFLITSSELFVGFLILRVDYALILAIVVAIIDFLPILGTGTVLIPWSLVMIFTKNYLLGFGLLVLYATVSVVRQIAEPKILGKSFGLHPIIALIGIYAGYRLFGFVGIILAPMTVALICSLLKKEPN